MQTGREGGGKGSEVEQWGKMELRPGPKLGLSLSRHVRNSHAPAKYCCCSFFLLLLLLFSCCLPQVFFFYFFLLLCCFCNCNIICYYTLHLVVVPALVVQFSFVGLWVSQLLPELRQSKREREREEGVYCK